MAKACAYLCRQCCFIDGFGEFGEFHPVSVEYYCPMYTMTCSNTSLPFHVYNEWQMNMLTPNLHLDYVSTNYCKEL